MPLHSKGTRRVVRSAPARISLSKKTPVYIPLDLVYAMGTRLNPYEKARLALSSKALYERFRNNLVAYRKLAGTKPLRRKGGPDYSLSLRGPPKEPPKKKQKK